MICARRWGAAVGLNWLLASILLHVVFGVVTACLIVKHFQNQKRIDFQAGPQPAPVDVEYKVQLVRKNDIGSAPPDLKRIVRRTFPPVTLSEIPDTPMPDDAVPTTVSADGLNGMLDSGAGSGLGLGGGDDGGDGPTILFGAPDGEAKGFAGYYYDLKQTPDLNPTGMTHGAFDEIIRDYYTRDWIEDGLNKYYRPKNPMAFTRLLFSVLSDKEGPKCFWEEKNGQSLC